MLAHLRMSDRALPGGQKALHLEELQSDWAQEGRKKGFKDQGDLAEVCCNSMNRYSRHGSDWPSTLNDFTCV